MSKLSTLIFALIIAVVSSAYADVTPPKPQSHFGTKESDWKKEPFEFLAFLIRQHDRGSVTVTLGDAPKGWIRKEHIGLLVLLLDSKEPCASVYPGRSSEVIPGSKGVKPSTVGREAAYLIASYRHGLFPMSGTDVSCHLEFDLNEIKRWWAKVSAATEADPLERIPCACKTKAKRCVSPGCKATTDEEHEIYNHKPRWVTVHEKTCPLATTSNEK